MNALLKPKQDMFIHMKKHVTAVTIGTLIVVSFCFGCCTPPCAEPVEYMHDRIREGLFGWISWMPPIPEGSKGTIRKNVLLCIGATNRADAKDFSKRDDAAEHIGKNLSAEELDLLYRFLSGELGGYDPLGWEKTESLKWGVCCSLCVENKSKPPDGFGLKLKEMVLNRGLRTEWRDDCVHFLASYYEIQWKDDPARMSNPERKIIEETLVKLTKERKFAYTALGRITDLSKKFPEIRSAMESNNIPILSDEEQIRKF